MSRRFHVAGNRWLDHPPPVLSPAQKDWLTRGGSLTRHLQAFGRVKVVVLNESVVGADGDEHGCLAVAPRHPLWSRDVMLTVDGSPMVVAHSVTRLAHSRSVWQAMRRLRTRPLADLLYHDTTVTRSILVCRALGRRHMLHRLAWQSGAQAPLPPRLWARRSVFQRHGAALLVTEAFLPRFWDMLNSQSLAAR